MSGCGDGDGELENWKSDHGRKRVVLYIQGCHGSCVAHLGRIELSYLEIWRFCGFGVRRI